jgi:hypothetical protein
MKKAVERPHYPVNLALSQVEAVARLAQVELFFDRRPQTADGRKTVEPQSHKDTKDSQRF